MLFSLAFFGDPLDTFLEAIWWFEKASWRRLGYVFGGFGGPELPPRRPKMGTNRPPNWPPNEKMDQEHVILPFQVARANGGHPFLTPQGAPRDPQRTPRHRQNSSQETKKHNQSKNNKNLKNDDLLNENCGFWEGKCCKKGWKLKKKWSRTQKEWHVTLHGRCGTQKWASQEPLQSLMGGSRGPKGPWERPK